MNESSGVPSASKSAHVLGGPGTVHLRTVPLAGQDTAQASYASTDAPLESVPIASESSHAASSGPSALTKLAQSWVTPARSMRHVGSSTHGTQHSAAVHEPGVTHAASAVDTIAPALPVAGHSNPRRHGYAGCSVRQERSVEVEGHEAWQASYAVTRLPAASGATAQEASQEATPRSSEATNSSQL